VDIWEKLARCTTPGEVKRMVEGNNWKLVVKGGDHLVRVWYSPINNGDGSASVKFFKTQKDAEADAIVQEAISGEPQWAEACVTYKDFKFDGSGNFLNPDEIEVDDFEEEDE